MKKNCGLSVETKCAICTIIMTILVFAWAGLAFYLLMDLNDSSAPTNRFQSLYEKGYVVCYVKYHTAGSFYESGFYGISVDELSDYKNGKNIVLSFHDGNGHTKMIASNEVISIEKEGEKL